MCIKRSSVLLTSKGKTFRIDECMREHVKKLREVYGLETVACCCGHGKYNMTIIIKGKDGVFHDFHTGIVINRKRRFYITDKKGYYYIPEVQEFYKEEKYDVDHEACNCVS